MARGMQQEKMRTLPCNSQGTAKCSMALPWRWPSRETPSEHKHYGRSRQALPEDTSVRSSYVPVLRSSLAMNQGQALKALELLQIAVPYELGTHRSSIHGNFGASTPPICVGRLIWRPTRVKRQR